MSSHVWPFVSLFCLLPLSLVPLLSLSLLLVLCPELQPPWCRERLSSSLSVSLPFVHSLHLLYLGHHPPCGRNRGVLNPLRIRRMRSIAPWRYRTLSHFSTKWVCFEGTHNRSIWTEWSLRHKYIRADIVNVGISWGMFLFCRAQNFDLTCLRYGPATWGGQQTGGARLRGRRQKLPRSRGPPQDDGWKKASGWRRRSKRRGGRRRDGLDLLGTAQHEALRAARVAREGRGVSDVQHAVPTNRERHREGFGRPPCVWIVLFSSCHFSHPYHFARARHMLNRLKKKEMQNAGRAYNELVTKHPDLERARRILLRTNGSSSKERSTSIHHLRRWRRSRPRQTDTKGGDERSKSLGTDCVTD